PFGVLRCVEKPTYDDLMNQQIQDVIKKKGRGRLKDLLYTDDTWTVTP
ncbi:MAG: 2-oxoacid:ferredoxin oxidoreductase subunit beta, partial [Elusimicrobia bacterium]|nr:2-oxoacid:ferredoxin oxidoreductase subunit beta [Elusimicrobiota bacterium]